MSKVPGILLVLFLFIFRSADADDKSLPEEDPEDYFTSLNKIEPALIIAAVDTLYITAEEFFYGYEFGPAFIRKKPDSKSRYLNYLINEKLLALNGFAEGIDTTETVEPILEEFILDIATEEMFRDDILAKVDVKPGEVDTAVSQKQIELEISWLFMPAEDSLNSVIEYLSGGISFDSLFALQLNDSVFTDERSMKTDRFLLGKKNPLLAGIIDTMQAGGISAPIEAPDGWYIIKLENVWKNLITTESEEQKLREEAGLSIKKRKMDALSDEYVHNLMLQYNPTIKKYPFSILRSYLARYNLEKEKYDMWRLDAWLEEALTAIDPLKQVDYGKRYLVVSDSLNITLDDFMNWFRNRSQYLKFDKSSFDAYSASLQNMIWDMVRDKILSKSAVERGYLQERDVIAQSRWWRDKIVYSAFRNELANSVLLKNEEVKSDTSVAEAADLGDQLSVEVYRKVQKLKDKYDVKIYEKALERVNVSEEFNPAAIEVYTVKKNGLIPRPAYPSIDYDWINWE